MSIFIFEIKAQWKNTLLWALVIAGIMLLFQGGVYPMFKESASDIMQMMTNMPKEFLLAVGFSGGMMVNFGSLYIMTYSYLSLLGAIMAMSASLAIFAREKRSKCSDFLLTKPLSRVSVYTQKAAAVLVLLAAADIITLLAAIFVFSVSGEPESEINKFILSTYGLFLTELIFASVGAAWSVWAKKIRSIAGTASAFGFGAFIMSAIYSITNEKLLGYTAPLKYFDPAHVYQYGGFETRLYLTAAIIFTVCAAASLYKFIRSDIAAG